MNNKIKQQTNTPPTDAPMIVPKDPPAPSVPISPPSATTSELSPKSVVRFWFWEDGDNYDEDDEGEDNDDDINEDVDVSDGDIEEVYEFPSHPQ